MPQALENLYFILFYFIFLYHFINLWAEPMMVVTYIVSVMGCSRCYLARYFGNLEGLEGSEMKGFWTAASAHALHLPSIIVQVFTIRFSQAWKNM